MVKVVGHPPPKLIKKLKKKKKKKKETKYLVPIIYCTADKKKNMVI
jgi:hypothetical protein